MFGAIWDRSRVVIEVITSQLGFIRVYMISLYHDVGSSTGPQAC